MATIKTLSPDEESRLLSYLRTARYGSHLPITLRRNHLIALLMLDAGLRNREAASLPLQTLETCINSTQSITISSFASKNGEPRTIPTSLRLLGAIDNYLEHRINNDPTKHNIYAFPGRHNRGYLGCKQIYRIISHAGQATLNQSIHPHMLRHTFATRLMRTAPIRVVQELLGHRKLSSTQVYTHPDTQDLRRAIESLGAGETQNTRHDENPPIQP